MALPTALAALFICASVSHAGPASATPASGSQAATAPPPCGFPRGGQPLVLTPLLRPAGQASPDPTGDYRDRLATTALGWPLQSLWCVWVEPPETDGPSATTERWQTAIAAALREWEQVLPLRIVLRPEQAQVTLWRRRPPLATDPAGRPRASHGRAILSLWKLDNGPRERVEPRVQVLIGAGQRREAIQATALHELGHAFGLWGHSPDPADAMTALPGSQPILRLSPRDRATVRWLYSQPTPLRSDP